MDQAGHVVYETDAQGNRIPDFSQCGYMGGGVAIPDVPVKVVVAPARGEGENGPRIQAALDYVARLPSDGRGIRGAVLLLAGRHEVAGRLRIAGSGVVLRGQGDGPDGTLVVATATGRRPLIQVEGESDRQIAPGRPRLVADSYVPVGALRLRLDNAEGLRVGDPILVTHPGTAAWIAALGMDRFPPGEKGSYLNWQPGTMDLRFDRVITAVDGATITLDAPLTTALDASLGAATLAAYTWPGRIAQVGVENLRCESTYDHANPHDEQHSWVAVSLDAAVDAWVRQVTTMHFAGSAVSIWEGCKRVTVQDCTALDPVSELGGYRRHAYLTSGQLTLFQRCRSEHGRHDFAAGSLAAGPNVFLECAATAAHGFSGPIESWASGVLYDNITIDGGGLFLTNREIDGQGSGWSAANCVLWQCTAPVITCRNPPGAANWAIGCWGQFLGNGHWQEPNEFVRPLSLYRGQLADRLGNSAGEALERRAIPAQAGDARSVDEAVPDLVQAQTEVGAGAGAVKPLAFRDGWITCDGKLLVGGHSVTTWWRGHVLPTRAPGFGLGVTRFVPGREGPGFTDDLDQLTSALRESGRAVLEHHWGLWYDRRRDDHQMVRRIDGDVWPPFYEQPWARSGQGHAWDGLSKYDLTKFNPWYFDRLAEFAGLCDRKGLALIHQAYFQHNILEAGAHWADFPWRPANCLQATGFPEPPPYENNKRVFMAEAFYDVTHPLRRSLHRLYIRKCLDTLGSHPNVIFVTGEEYTGPLEFLRFWLDTVVEWERETGKDVVLGLSSTKDVQDAILNDPVCNPAVSVIELKYWWYAADGSLYAPEGGQNLAPRQQLREWKGSRSRSDEQTARQVREYRDRYPDKAILSAHEHADPWAVLAAGGSIPALPSGVDPELLAALPRLRPCGSSVPVARQWTLAEPGRQYFVYASPGAPIQLDLSADPATFTAYRIDRGTGQAVRSSSSALIQGGKVVDLPAPASGPSVLWLKCDARPLEPNP
jgi:hypothetical protein